MTNIKGCDLSKWEKGLKINDVIKAGYQFAIIRGGYTGYGILRVKNVDPCFEDFYKQAKALDFSVGCYYYSCANTKKGGVDEAEYFYKKCLKGKKFEYPIYIDVEESRWQADDKTGVTDAILGFWETLTAKGYLVGVYSSPRWFEKKIDTARLENVTKWVASWQSKAPEVSFSGFDLWQNSDNGSVGGHKIDTDVSFVDFPAVIKANGLNGYVVLKSVDEIVAEIFKNKWGKGSTRKKKLTEAGYDYNKVQARVNEYSRIAREVKNGKWGKGSARKEALKKAGYDYDLVQTLVGELSR